MILELHDSETEGTLVARVSDIDYDYQAEEWVQQSHSFPEARRVTKWVLSDEEGVRCVWERDVGSTEIPTIMQRSGRFTGTWERGPSEVII